MMLQHSLMRSTLNRAPASCVLTAIAVCECNDIVPTRTRDTPFASAMNTSSWSCRYSSTQPPSASVSTISSAAFLPTSSAVMRRSPMAVQPKTQPVLVTAVTCTQLPMPLLSADTSCAAQQTAGMCATPSSTPFAASHSRSAT
eukprot:TRINITY_DN4729_c0_g1_i2.p3 TRINITY_DN4729_c0_g1~~TRINITY_DN4729_c0_g1_i2.p3  ORF type:complete len:143 (-),score=26.26 TRINITY_DN4729_c0_g1_i2:835-1263(-)